ncbi:SDR family NAD(P)-dependent oxidoreductase [Streptomyces poriferorum]|uniref:SDR family NAD(P)-dependent oxidoreductase n=1 Tax=Streptomyces poriferorum TaxID=2798799 RepID=A0ABY9J2G7_9ACTN|nr:MULTISPECIES: SDR family NAD(P)-dependent oxidoreductase [unclassified Streptomyces]MDP5309962.1 SDR family NAD(P)-dependent oxidoreductase [Streptomyces sp. Alt4]WLQ46545.1 SDR family NAD(P)-dependent oxidoreductase [Streptomyces sp. Alt1]WLQ60866.1 SDR family NAD(P)-dependent oxidoreductase [Streptomyces sp. Alt2]
MSKVFLITGAGRGLGADIARRALAAGHRVVATGRDPERVLDALGGEQDNLLAAPLDITDRAAARRAAEAAVERFGRVDVLINNAADFYAGYFEELSPAQMRAQIETNLFGPMNVTRAVLPVMRAQRDGHIITISSLAGVVGLEFCVAYAAAKFGVEGFMESLRHDVEPFGIRTTVVEPGFFRTELLVDTSTTWAELSVEDYAERTAATRKVWESMNGQQAGDPAKLADALLTLAGQEQPPARFVAGADAIEAVVAKAKDLLAEAEASRELGGDLAHATAD